MIIEKFKRFGALFAPRFGDRVVWKPWLWAILGCLLIGGSGGVHAWQDYRFATIKERVEAPPFPLKDLPMILGEGEWRVRDGGEMSLDPEVARVAGCSDSVIRSYTNATTGVSLTILVLFGPAQDVFSHVPEVCYPAAGYQMDDTGLLRSLAIGSGQSAEFRTEVYARNGERHRRREEVYYTFRFGNRWSPDPQLYWKDFRHQPSMFKVQVQRPVPASELREVSNPTEQFLSLLLPEIESRISQMQSGAKK